MRGSSWAKWPFLLWVACGDELAPVDGATGDAAVRDADAGDAANDAGAISTDAGCSADDFPVRGTRVDEQRQCFAETALVGCVPGGPLVGGGAALSYGRDADGVLWMFTSTLQPSEVVSESIDLGQYPPCDALSDGADLGLTAMIAGEWIELTADPAQPLYTRGCGAIVLSEERANRWLPVPQSADAPPGPYLVDGRPPVDAGCDPSACVPIDGQRVSREKVVDEDSDPPQPSDPAAGPRFSTLLASSPLRLQISAFADAQCTDTTSRSLVQVEVAEAALPLPAAHETIIRITNGSERVLARRATGCGVEGETELGVYRAAGESTSRRSCLVPRCEEYTPVTPPVVAAIPCGRPTCSEEPVNLAPGASEPDFVYDGVQRRLTDILCEERVPLAPGTPMVARVCYGTPSLQSAFDIELVECHDHPFAYGQATLDITLD